MKSIGMVRILDNLGRIVIPKEMRASMSIQEGDTVEIFVDNDKNVVAFRKYNGVACIMCKSFDNLTYFKDALLCSSCIDELKRGEHSEEVMHESARDIDKKRFRSKELIVILKELLTTNPGLTQAEYGELLGVSQGRVSKLMQDIKLLEGYDTTKY